MRSMAILLGAAAFFASSGGASYGGGLTGDFGAGALSGAGAFSPLQRGFGAAEAPWRPDGQEQRAQPTPGFSTRDPDDRRHNRRRRPYGYGVGLASPYFDDYDDGIIEEEFPPLQGPSQPPSTPTVSLGPKTVSSPPASSSTPAGGSPCARGRKVSMGVGRPAAFGCISP